MIETSQDILLITLSGSVGLLTIFLCWMLYYLAQLLHEALKLVRDVRAKIDEFFEILDQLKEKLTSSVSQLGFVSDSLSQIVKFFVSTKVASNTGKKKKRRDSDEDEE